MISEALPYAIGIFDHIESKGVSDEAHRLRDLFCETRERLWSSVSLGVSREECLHQLLDVWMEGAMYTHVIRVCNEAESAARACPIFPSPVVRLSWPFEDPASFQRSRGAKLEQMRSVRNAIESRVREWCDSVCAVSGDQQLIASNSV